MDDLCAERGKLFLDDEPNGCMVDAEIVVDHDVAKANHPFPWNVRNC